MIGSRLIVSFFVLFLILFFTNFCFAVNGKDVFEKKCKLCHNTSEITKIGPGMRGIRDRTSKNWLKRFIMDPQGVWEKNKGYTEKLKRTLNREDSLLTRMKYRKNKSPTAVETNAVIKYISGFRKYYFDKF